MRSVARELARREYPGQRRRNEDLPLNPQRLGGGIYFASFDDAGRFGFSATAGILLSGVDATVKVWRRNYLTAAFSVPDQGQLFLQRRAFNSPELGAAVGVGTRWDTYGFEQRGFDIDTRGVHSLGVRGFSIYRAEGDTGGGVKLGVYAGYVPTLEHLLLSMTLTVGRF